MPRSSNGQDGTFSASRRGFDSLSGYVARVVIWLDEYESPWECVLYRIDPQHEAAYAERYPGDMYDVPEELAAKYDTAMQMRDECDKELLEIVKEARGRLFP